MTPGLKKTVGAVLTSVPGATSLFILIVTVALALFAPMLGLPDPAAMEFALYQPPGPEHWLGTDNFGRDVLSRVIWGAQVALMVALGAAMLSILLGSILGAVAGYFGGVVDGLLSRLFDIFLLIPTFFLILLIVALFGASLPLTIIAIALTTWPRSARLMRSQVLTLKSRVYVQAALAAGAPHWWVIVRHVIPNGIAPIITDGTILMGMAILTEAGLSFLGLGDQNLVSWGGMIFEGQRHLRLAPWMSIAPGVALLLLVASLNLLGDSINFGLNPQLRLRGGAPRRRATVTPPPGETAPDDGTPILEVENLRLEYRAGERHIVAVDGVSFSLPRGGSLGIVGESGCGKSSLGSALLQTMPNNAELTSGTIRFDGRAIVLDGRPVVENGRSRIDALRWTKMATIFQSAMNALNPVTTVRRQMIDAIRLHRPNMSTGDATARIGEIFDMIGIPRARMNAYPHQLSGGMRQRAMIALSLILEPDLVIADEPTTALDMLIQDQILGEIADLRDRMNLSLILVSHDMGAVAESCDTVAVMYAGRIVEIAPTRRIFDRPTHPYTRTLIGSLPSLTGPKRILESLPATDTATAAASAGCRFAHACPSATDLCRGTPPPTVALTPGHTSECHYAEALAAEPEGADA